jgi:hypothetical protein
MEPTELTAQELGDLQQYQLVRQHAQQILAALHGLESMQTRWNALASADNMIDGQGAFNGITKTQVGSVVFDTANALRALLDAGHGTNLEKVA